MPPDEHALGPLEMKVLGLLDARTGIAVEDVQSALARAGSALAYTTVMTVLARLYEKGLVERTKEGRRYLYRAGRRAPGVTKKLVARIQKALFPGDRTRPLLALLDDAALSPDDLKLLRRKIDERLKTRS